MPFEFTRLETPDLILIAAKRPRNFIIQCADMRKRRDIKPFELGGASSFKDTEQSLLDYDNGKFCHDSTGGGGVLDRSFYGETCIPQKYAEENWTMHFSSANFIYE